MGNPYRRHKENQNRNKALRTGLFYTTELQESSKSGNIKL